jgi:hypothetical protein
MKFRPFIALFALMLLSPLVMAQFGGQMKQIGPPGSNLNQSQQKDDTTGITGITREPYPLRRYFKSLAGKDSMNITRMWAGSFIIPGSAQLYNKEYWKIPVVYATVGGFLFAGYRSNVAWHRSGLQRDRDTRDLLYLGAALSYWGSVLDGVKNFRYHKDVLPARASLYSAMLPGLGQYYNGDYWKIPIIYGGIITVGYFISSNNSQFQRYKYLYYETSNPDSPLAGKFNAQTMKYYKDTYRRFRDYSILAGVFVYALNIIDANVFAHFQDFDVSEDLTASLFPGIIMPVAPQFTNNSGPMVGFNLKLNF